MLQLDRVFRLCTAIYAAQDGCIELELFFRALLRQFC